MKNNQKISISVLLFVQRGRGSHAHSRPYSSGCAGRRLDTNNPHNSIPATNPPTCAHHAIPPTSCGPANASVPLNNWLKNQNPRYKTAGTSKKKGKKKIGNSTTSRAVGKNSRYAPSTPAIAPEAPTDGTVESEFVSN